MSYKSPPRDTPFEVLTREAFVNMKVGDTVYWLDTFKKYVIAEGVVVPEAEAKPKLSYPLVPQLTYLMVLWLDNNTYSSYPMSEALALIGVPPVSKVNNWDDLFELN